MNAREKIIAARTAMVLDQPFFGALALRLALCEDATCETAWTDGRSLGYSPTFAERLTHSQLTALIAHEVMHCAAGHPWRRDGRDGGRWNIACDKAINTVLAESGFTLPPDGLYAEGAEKGQSAEWIYARLPEPQRGEGDGQGDGVAASDDAGKSQSPSPSPNSLGEVRDAPAASDDPAPTEADWRQAVQQAALAAKAQGSLPSSLDRFAGDAAKPSIDWRSVLRRFVQSARSDYSWQRPNRRYIAHGIYLPALESEELGEIAIAVDTSGSIDDVALAQARSEIEAVIDECQPTGVTIYYADAAVAHEDHVARGESLVWRPAGGGGTDFRPVFAACETAEIAPTCLIYISDLEGTFPQSSDVPVLWITNSAATAPIGETVRVQ